MKNAFTRLSKAFLVLLFLAVGLRLAAPWLLKFYLNRQLSTLENYVGHVEDIDMSLIRGAYQIEGLRFEKRNSETPKPFIELRRADLSLWWGALFKGRIVGKLYIDGFELNFTDSKKESERQSGAGEAWQDVVKKFFPVRFENIDVQNSAVRLMRMDVNPPVNIAVEKINAQAKNFSTLETPSYSKEGGNNVKLEAVTTGSAQLSISGRVDPLSSPPLFDVNVSLSNFELVELNPFFRAYANIDFKSGLANISGEMATKDMLVKGYVKPVFSNIAIASWEQDIVQDQDSLLDFFWEALVGSASEAFENQGKGQFAAKLPFEGRLDGPDTNIWFALGSMLQNAFVRALSPWVDDSVKLSDLRSVEENQHKEKSSSVNKEIREVKLNHVGANRAQIDKGEEGAKSNVKRETNVKEK